MTEVIATYEDAAGNRHEIELVEGPQGALAVDRGGRTPRVVCELEPDEGVGQALAALEAGGYLERAREARRPLCRRLCACEPALAEHRGSDEHVEASEPGLARAA
jgi:hypothetical protein